MTSIETAKDLIAFAGGPPIFGVVVVLTWIARTLKDRNWYAWKEWLVLAAGILLLIWLALFVILSSFHPAWRS